MITCFPEKVNNMCPKINILFSEADTEIRCEGVNKT